MKEIELTYRLADCLYKQNVHGMPFSDCLECAQELKKVIDEGAIHCPTCGDHDCQGVLPCETGDGV